MPTHSAIPLLYIAHHPADRAVLAQLSKQFKVLERQQKLALWHAEMIRAGANAAKVKQLGLPQLGVLLHPPKRHDPSLTIPPKSH